MALATVFPAPLLYLRRPFFLAGIVAVLNYLAEINAAIERLYWRFSPGFVYVAGRRGTRYHWDDHATCIPTKTLLRTSGYRNAEVVELADTPSEAITLAILYKLLILQLLPLSSITSKDPPKDAQ
jgi:hypothetical protein